ncbi:uncharacterized protein PITG_22747 [Phytophthora infestans T30-4]|uniref:ZSWIM1/3 RNaseH-like domain-containing protein n=1 Tax=Phytophthora infestans (strain T30-4) TaxID=403677 RepID=D0N1Y4_PHYIT|nr:uncharacterized protein PITG_22747 [Phytophthora infestans T30-4]EEY68313.1 conserved hypothetical protein [Phytophthora infestans T30-4]|eukprot:XP_002905472.1 conserved hypothetical protein [Phytophthora infestans T30-4]
MKLTFVVLCAIGYAESCDLHHIANKAHANTIRPFPEVLMIDATHGTNRSKYKVFSFMAHDTFGKGQFVQHALLQNERYETLLTATEEFKANNPAWSRLQCVLVDKDFTELSVLEKAFPGVTVLLCQFHVLKYLREEIASADYGFSRSQKEQLGGVVSLLVYAKTEAEYDKRLQYMVHLASIGYAGPVANDRSGIVVGVESGSVGVESGSVGVEVTDHELEDISSRIDKHPFVKYFRKNWDSCRELWCAHRRQNTVTLGNNTNNRLEASWKHLKEWVDSFMGVYECIASTMYYQTLQERLFIAEVYKNVTVQHPDYDSEMTLVANIVSEHACELIFGQYSYAIGSASYTFYEGCPDVYFIKSISTADDALDEMNAEYSVTKREWKYSCLFMCTRLLPCRHVFYLRKALGQATVIPTLLLNRRWLLSTVRAAIENSSVVSDTAEPKSFEVKNVISSQARPWDSSRKYREALQFASQICDTMAGLGMTQYKEAMQYLQSVTGRFKRGKFEDPGVPILPPAESERHGSTSSSRDDALSPPLLTGHDPTARPTHHVSTELLTRHADTVNVSHVSPTVSESDHATSCNSVETTQVADLSVQSVSIGGQSGSIGGISGPVEEESGPVGEELDTVGKELDTVGDVELSTLPPAAEDTPFVIASPPRSRGRPRQTARSKKAARKKTVIVAQEDSELYASNLSLASVDAALSSDATYISSAAAVNKFKMVEYGFKFKTPTARTISSLPPTIALIPAESITRILRPEQIAICRKKVSALQSKHKGLAESAVALDISGFGAYSTSTIGIMNRWHMAIKVVKQVEKAVKWVEIIDFTLPMPAAFQVVLQTDMLSKMQSIPLLSAKVRRRNHAITTTLSN